MMKRIPHKNAVYLNSEVLKTINYDESKNILEAVFTNDRIYQYKNVPGNVWMEFLAAIHSGDSAGAFLNKEIKPFYNCRELI
jgi:KTSC domain